MSRALVADAGARRRPGARGRLAAAAVAGALALLVPASSAWAGRMVATGEVADVACDVNNNAGACHFLRVALDYVRSGAPNPNAPILLFDESPFHMRNAIKKAYGGTPPFSIDTQNPSLTDFNSFQINTSLFSAMVVASDYTCGSGAPCGDLNPNTYGQITGSPSHPCYANDPDPQPQVPFELTCFTNDSDALIAPPGHTAINRFYNAGGGILAGSGGDNGDGHADDLYYDFLPVPRGLLFNGDPSSITGSGAAIGFASGDIGHASLTCPPAPSFTSAIFTQCPFDAFFPLPAGSSLRVAEVDNSGDPVTLFQDTDPPRTAITGAPPTMVVSRGPTSASFAFTPSENFVTFQCQLDNSGFQPCGSPVTYFNLGEGNHVFTVRAIDAAGNIEAAPPTYVFLVAFDRDGDGWTRFSNPPDCNDSNPLIHPFAFQPPGSTTNFNCTGKLVPFPQINPRVGFEVSPGANSSQFFNLVVNALPAGSTVSVTCGGVKRCPFRASKFHVKKNNGQVSLTRLLKGKHLPAGMRLIIRVTHPQQIGGYVALLIQHSAAPAVQHRCMNPGKTKPQSFCPQFT